VLCKPGPLSYSPKIALRSIPAEHGERRSFP
jgi:hypothetical protein